MSNTITIINKESNFTFHIECFEIFADKTYVRFESNSCDRRRFFIKLADENAIGFMSSSNESSLKTANVFNDDAFGCGTVFG